MKSQQMVLSKVLRTETGDTKLISPKVLTLEPFIFWMEQRLRQGILGSEEPAEDVTKLPMIVLVGQGKRFDRKKVRIAEKVEPFSGRTFFLQIFLCSYRSSYPTKMADHSF